MIHQPTANTGRIPGFEEGDKKKTDSWEDDQNHRFGANDQRDHA